MDLLTNLLFQLARTMILWVINWVVEFIVCQILRFVCRPNIVGSGGMCSCLTTSSLCLFATEMEFVGRRVMQLRPNFVLVLFYFFVFYFISRLQIYFI